MNEAQRLMAARMGLPISQQGQANLPGVDQMETELKARGGDPQQLRMIQDKRKTLDRVVWNSYQGAFIQKMDGLTPINHPPIKGLINPNKLKQDYDDKILSVGFEHKFNCGDIFKWCETNTYWLITLQELTELAYFKGEIRRCRHILEWLDEDGKTHSTYAAVKGPVETKINYIQKHLISIDEPNFSLSILMPLNEYTKSYFNRYSKFYLDDKCWRIEATDGISMPNVLQVVAVEYFANEFEDEDGLVGKLIERPAQEDDEHDDIIGPTLIKPKIVYKYRLRDGLTGDWSFDSSLPIIFTRTEDGAELMWDDYKTAKFELSFGTSKKIITVDSLF